MLQECYHSKLKIKDNTYEPGLEGVKSHAMAFDVNEKFYLANKTVCGK